MKLELGIICLPLIHLLVSMETSGQIVNADFESGSLAGWTADDNWTVDDNSAGGWYSGWEGKRYAWSGHGGERATGKLRSSTFTLDNEGVEVWMAGWADVGGKSFDRWNYVTLNRVDGTELDRIYAPNSVAFTPVILDGSGHQGEFVYVEAVDDAGEDSYSMLCVDHLRTTEVPRSPPEPDFDSSRSVILENEFYRVEVERDHGVLKRILDKTADIDLIREPRLADNFKFSLPLPGKEAWQATEANYILGKQQRLSSIEQTEGNLALHWNGPLKNVSGHPYDVSVTLTLALVDRQVRFGLEIENRTDKEIGEVFYPILGGIHGLRKQGPGGFRDWKRTELVTPNGAGVASARIFHTFANMSWLGVLGLEQYYAYPDTLSMPWMEFNHPRLGRAVYFGAHDPVARHKVLHLELAPGGASARFDGNWPRWEELDGLPCGVLLSFAQIAYEKPGKDFEASPVALEFHDGDWREGAKIYRRWFESMFDTQAPRPSWMRNQMAFQDCGAVPFRDLPRWAREGVRYGVKGLLVSGWKAGGNDDGIPFFEPDPKLGTRDDLAGALRECHDSGVKVFFLLRNQPVSMDQDWYRRELYRYACMDRWGVTQTAYGWGRGASLSEQLGAGERRARLNPGSRGFGELLIRKVRELAELGADGIHLQEFFVNPLDFNPQLGRTPDRASWEGALETIAGLLSACREINPEFSLSIDTVRDRLQEYTCVSWTDLGETSAFRASFPFWRPVLTVTRGDQYSVVNTALRNGAALRIAPAAGPVSMDHESLKELSAYLAETLRIQEELAGVLISGELLDANQIRVEGDVDYGVFRDPETGRRACVLTNPHPSPIEAEVAGFEGGEMETVVVRAPFEQERQARLPLSVEIPASTFMVVAESGAGVASDRR